MKVRIFDLAVKFAFLVVCAFLFFSCDFLLDMLDVEDPDEDSSFDISDIEYNAEFVQFNNLSFPKVMHYGADLGIFPKRARDWIINTAFSQERMEREFMRNSSLKAWWSDDNNSILFEASYTVAPGYVGAGTISKWGEAARWNGSSSIFDTYGEYAYYQTLRFKYEHSLFVENLLKNDSAFKEIIDFAKKLSSEIEYDWRNFSGYQGAPAIRTPGKTYEVCDGYARIVSERALELNSVSSVQRWTSVGHAWNVLKLTDGRTLYFDLTWFDNESIDAQTGKIIQTDDYGWENITFFEHLFRFSNIGYGSKVFHHNIGSFHSERVKN